MPNYRRVVRPGGTFFFTVVTERRAKILCDDAARSILRSAIDQCRVRRPFELEAVVLLPDHWHPLITLPDDDTDYSVRLASIKANFTRDWLAAGGRESPRTVSMRRHGNRAVWQKRFWEHTIGDDEDWGAHLDYIHYNPVKHGLVTCPHLWPWSSFAKWVRRGVYTRDWMCVCDGRQVEPPSFFQFDGWDME